MTFSNLEERHLSNCKNYKDEKVMYDKLISQFENVESFENLNRTSRNLHRLAEGHMEISHESMLLMGLSIDQLDKTQSRLDKTDLDLKETKADLKETKDKLDKTELDLKETKADLKETKADLKETKDKLDKTELELKETKADLKETKADLKETKADSKETKNRLELYLNNTTNILNETKERLGNELSEMKTELKKTQDELKDTKAMTKLLSVHRDWIGIFNRKLKMKLGEDVFNEIKEAMDDARTYQTDITQCSCVKKLEEILEKVGMSFKDFKLLFETKQLSNKKFHKSPDQTIKDAKEQLLRDSFPEEQKNLVTSLTKLFNALEIWDPRH
ncbi:hypothetical protein RirG_140130 [Rhizophagus irregularis DAOM 197198w]|nr:hypothetical protein RirG_140130 [Rhizophagus irregularis DAOM 197198w]